jgi:DNA-binding transcriptional ArsR family regulator
VRSNISTAFTFADLQRALPDVSPDHIRGELRKLRDTGAVESPGPGRKVWRRLRDDF